MIKKIFYIISICLSIMFCSGSGHAESDWLEVDGYVKSFFMVSIPTEVKGDPESEDLPAEGIVLNKLRLKLSLRPTDYVLGEISYDLIPRIEGNSEFFSSFHSI